MADLSEKASALAISHVSAGLADVLEALGEELREANRRLRTNGEPATLMLGGATVELSIVVQAEAHGGVKFYVIDASTAGQVARSGKVTINLYGQSEYGVGK